jgi:hypothetical protein
MLRLLKVDNAHFGALINKPPTTAELPKHLFVNWPAADAITEIVLSRTPKSLLSSGRALKSKLWTRHCETA